jgi:hypothetical protein
MNLIQRLEYMARTDPRNEKCAQAAIKEIEKLRKENAELRKRTEWLPIETAPKDGTMYFFGVGKPDGNEDFRGVFDAERFEILRYWMPMAKPPKTTGGE